MRCLKSVCVGANNEKSCVRISVKTTGWVDNQWNRNSAVLSIISKSRVIIQIRGTASWSCFALGTVRRNRVTFKLCPGRDIGAHYNTPLLNTRNLTHVTPRLCYLRGLGLSPELQPLWGITGTDAVYDRN